MTVEELLEELRLMPLTAHVDVQIRKNVTYDDSIEELYEFREVTVDTVVYRYGVVLIQLDE